MAEVEIKAGAKFHILNRHELRDELTRHQASWMTEVARGIRARRFTAFGDATAGGALTIGETGEQRIGPDQGYVWLLKRLTVTNYTPASQSLALFHGTTEASAAIIPVLTATATVDIDEFVPGSDRLIITGTVAASARCWVTGWAWEAPEALAWKLL